MTKYDSGVLCASIRVLVKSNHSEKRSLQSSDCEDFPPATEPEGATDEENTCEAEPEPAAEQASPYDYPCELEVARVEDDQITKDDAEPEAIEAEEYVDVREMEGKPCDNYEYDSTSDKPVDPEVEPDNIE